MMDRLLAEYFGNTVKTASAAVAPQVASDEAEKVAQIEIFEKLAAEEGIDLEKLSEEQIGYLWNQVFAKEASAEEGKKDDDKGEKEKDSEGDPAEAKKEEAKKEHEEKKEAAAKLAEAAYLGKVMAHSLVSELNKIAAAHGAGEGTDAGEQVAEGENKEAAMPPHLAKALGKGKELAGKAGKSVGDAAKRGKELLTGSKLKEHIGNASSKAPSVQHLHMDEAMNEARKVTKARIGAGAAAAGAAAGAGVAAAKAGKKKESSAIDELALEAAVKIAEAGGFDGEEAAQRVLGVYHLSLLGESEKIAAAADTDAAIEIRALEFLETAGYPVTWNEG